MTMEQGKILATLMGRILVHQHPKDKTFLYFRDAHDPQAPAWLQIRLDPEVQDVDVLLALWTAFDEGRRAGFRGGEEAKIREIKNILEIAQ